MACEPAHTDFLLGREGGSTKVEQAKRCFLCRYNTRVGIEWDSGLAETSGVKAAAQHNPPLREH